MSIGTALAKRRTPAERLETSSHVTLDMTGERPQINRIAVEVRGTVPGIDDATFRGGRAAGRRRLSHHPRGDERRRDGRDRRGARLKVLPAGRSAAWELGDLPDGVRVVEVEPRGLLRRMRAARTSSCSRSTWRGGWRSRPQPCAPVVSSRRSAPASTGCCRASRDHIVLCSARGVHDPSVSEWCAAAILAMERRLFEFRDFQREARWERDVNPVSGRGDSSLDDIHDLDGHRVLVVGHGSIGRALERRLQPFGAAVTGVARTARASVEAPDQLPRLCPTRTSSSSSRPSPPRPSGWSTPASSAG